MEKQEQLLPKKRIVNRVPLAIYSRLTIWLSANKDRVASMYCTEIAALAKKELAIEMPIGDQTIRTICRSCSIVYKANKMIGANGKATPGQRLAAMEKQVAELTTRLTNLEISLGGVRN